MPRSRRLQSGDTGGASRKTFGPGTQPLVLTSYTPIVGKGTTQEIHGGLELLGAAGAPLDSGTDIVRTTGIGKLFFVVNAGSDLVGTITVTGTSVDRDTGVETPSDTEDLPVDGLTTDGSDTDSNGHARYEFTDAYITTKWFTGSVTVSTTDLTLTDVDMYHSSFEQFNHNGDYIVDAFDINLLTVGATAELDAYLYEVDIVGDKMHLSRIASLNSGATTDGLVYRLRKGNIGRALHGSTDGIFVNAWTSGAGKIEEFNTKVWVHLFGTGTNVLALSLVGVKNAANIVDNSVVRGDGGTDGIQGSTASLSDAGVLTLDDGSGNTVFITPTASAPTILTSETTLAVGAANSGGSATLLLRNSTLTQATVLRVGTNLAGGTGSIQADDIAALRTNTDLNLSGNGTGGVVADGVDVGAHDHSSSSGQTRLAAKDRTITKIVYIETPTDGDEFPIAFIADDMTMVTVNSVTDTGTVDFNIERRATNTPDVAGTDVLTADLTADDGGEATTTFDNSGDVDAEEWLVYKDQSNPTGSPTKLWVSLELLIK